jgi:cell division protein FtsA
MEQQKIVVGLDIGTTKICAIVGVKNQFGKLEVIGMGKAPSDGVRHGMVINIDKTTNAIKKAIAEAEEMANINIGVVNVGIAGQHIRSSIYHNSITRQSHEGLISVEDVNNLTNDTYKSVTPPGSKIIHVMPQDYIIDFEPGIKDPVGMQGTKLEADFHVITAHTTAIDNIRRCVNYAGLEVDNLILEPLASSLSVLTEEEKEAGVALIDIGGGTTDIAIFYDNIIRHTAVIPFGGNVITEDIKEGCNVMLNQAEQLKVKFGMAIAEEADHNKVIVIDGFRNRAQKHISVKNLAHIIEARMEEIIELAYAEILNCRFSKKLSAGLVITGGGSQLQFLKQKIEHQTGMETRIGLPNEHLGKSKVEEIKSAMYATSVGLVLSGFRALDYRENAYAELNTNNSQRVNRKSGVRETSGDFFSKLLAKTKSILTDDLDDKKGY